VAGVIKKTDGDKKKSLIARAASPKPAPTAGETSGVPWDSVAFSRYIQGEITRWKGRAASMRRERERELAGEIERAFDEGYEKGFKDGIEKESMDRIKSIEALLSEAKKKKRKAIHDLEVQIIELAVSIAEKIIRKSIEADPAISESIVAETMAHIIGSEKIVLKVSQNDFTTINAKYNRWMGMAGGVTEFKIEIDKRLRTGDYIVESEGGIIDSVVLDRINVIVDELLKVSH